ncbi:helix-turn-helix domain-containing protein [Schaalia cardiffensis]
MASMTMERDGIGVSSRGSRTVLPPEDRRELHEIDQLLAAQPRLVDHQGHAIPLPEEVFSVLRDVVEAMQAGRAIVLTPTAMRLTTGEAAEILGVSRPTLVKLLEDGKIPFDKPNRHRYVMLEDLERYRAKRAAERRAAIMRFSESAREHQFDDPTPEEVAEAVRVVRSGMSTE